MFFFLLKVELEKSIKSRKSGNDGDRERHKGINEGAE